MAFAFNATPKSTAANSYGTVEEADDHFAGIPGREAWAALPTLTKQKYLVGACNRLEVETYIGEKTTQGQRLKHPRVGMLDDAGYEWDIDVVVRYVKEAQFEMAWVLKQSGSTDFFADTGLEGFTSVTLGPLSLNRNMAYMAAQLPQTVSRLLRGFRLGAHIVRG